MRSDERFAALLAALLEAGNLVNDGAPQGAAAAFRLEPTLRRPLGGGGTTADGGLVAAAARMLAAADPEFARMPAAMAAVRDAARPERLAAATRDVRALQEGLQGVQALAGSPLAPAGEEEAAALSPAALEQLKMEVDGVARALGRARAAAVAAAGFLGEGRWVEDLAEEADDAAVAAALEVLAAAWDGISRAAAALAGLGDGGTRPPPPSQVSALPLPPADLPSPVVLRLVGAGGSDLLQTGDATGVTRIEALPAGPGPIARPPAQFQGRESGCAGHDAVGGHSWVDGGRRAVKNAIVPKSVSAVGCVQPRQGTPVHDC